MRQRPKLLRRIGMALTGALAALSPMAQRTPLPNAPTTQQGQQKQTAITATETPVARVAERLLGSGHQRRAYGGGFIWVGRTLRGRSGGKRRRHDYRR